MALQKTITNEQGIIAEYWIAQPNIDSINKKITVVLLGFANQTYRNNGANPIMNKSVYGEIEGVEHTWQEIYDFCKEDKFTEERPEDIVYGEDFVPTEIENIFSDAEDV